MKDEWTISLVIILAALIVAGAMCAGCKTTPLSTDGEFIVPGGITVRNKTQNAPARNAGSSVTIDGLTVTGPAANIFAARWGQGIDDLGFLAGADRLRALEEENERLARLIEARLAAEEREADDAEVVE